MDSLPERLREQADEQEDERIIRMGREPWLTDREAADELDRLGAQVAELKAEIAAWLGREQNSALRVMRDRHIKALAHQAKQHTAAKYAGQTKLREQLKNQGDIIRTAEAELAALRHDIERQVQITSEQATQIEALRRVAGEARMRLAGDGQHTGANYVGDCPVCILIVNLDAALAAPEAKG